MPPGKIHQRCWGMFASVGRGLIRLLSVLATSGATYLRLVSHTLKQRIFAEVCISICPKGISKHIPMCMWSRKSTRKPSNGQSSRAHSTGGSSGGRSYPGQPILAAEDSAERFRPLKVTVYAATVSRESCRCGRYHGAVGSTRGWERPF